MKDTLRPNPPEKATMKKASVVAVFTTTFFYLCCGGFGYAAFGNSTPGNLLTGFGFYEPYWLIDLANACVVLHLVGGYQVYLISQNFSILFFYLRSESSISCTSRCSVNLCMQVSKKRSRRSSLTVGSCTGR